MVRLWLFLRRIRQHATPRSAERREIEAYLRNQNVFEAVRTGSSWVRVFSGVVAAVLVLCVGLSSYAYASEAVLPDTVFYPVREAIEQVEVALAVTPVQKQKVEKKLEVRRVKEVKKLTELKRPVPAPLKKYVGATAATTTNALLKKTQQEKKEEQKAEREERREDARKKTQERLQNRFNLPKNRNKGNEAARIIVPTSSQRIVPKEESERSRSQAEVLEQKQRERQTLLEQRRMLLEKRAQERQKQREEARNRERTRTERERRD